MHESIGGCAAATLVVCSHDPHDAGSLLAVACCFHCTAIQWNVSSQGPVLTDILLSTEALSASIKDSGKQPPPTPLLFNHGLITVQPYYAIMLHKKLAELIASLTLSTSLSICLFVYLSIFLDLSIDLSVSPSIFLDLPIHLSVCLCICLFPSVLFPLSLPISVSLT